MNDKQIIEAAQLEQQSNDFCEVCGQVITNGRDMCGECYRTLKENFLI